MIGLHASIVGCVFAAAVTRIAVGDSVASLQMPHVILPSDSSAYDAAGWSVALEADVHVLGVRGKDNGGVNRGAVYIHRRQGGGWIQSQKLTPNIPVDREEFGYSIAASGNLIVVGAPQSNRDANDGGSAWIFVSNGVSYLEAARIASPTASLNGRFGSDVEVSDGAIRTLAVGAAGESTQGVAAGQVHLFEEVQGAWVHRQSLQGNAVPTAQDEFGLSLALSGEALAVGSPGEDIPGGASNVGAVRVFRRSIEGLWNLEAVIASPMPSESGEFGRAVSLSGEVLAVGAYREDAGAESSGRVHIFRRQKGAWVHESSLQCPQVGVGAEFGASVALDRDALIVGATRLDTGNGTTGGAFLFRRSLTFDWQCYGRLTSQNPQAAEFAGTAVALRNLDVAMGAPLRSVGAPYQGAAYIAALAADCNGDLTPDLIELAAGAADCNVNAVPDACDIAAGEPDDDGNGVPDVCEVVKCREDLSGNGSVNAADLALLLSLWATDGSKFNSDLNDDGFVGGADLALLLAAWGACP